MKNNEEMLKKFPTMKSLDGVNKKNDVNNTASEAPEKNVKTESEKIDFSSLPFVMLRCAISIKLSSLHHHS